MVSSIVQSSTGFLLAVLLGASAALAQTTAKSPIREVFVPYEDLNVILDSDKNRIFLTREEYEALIEQAKVKPQTPAPHKVAIVAAEYDGQLEEGRALVTGRLTIEVLEDGLFALPLELGGVGIRSAILDEKAAPLARDGQGPPKLLLQNKGLHKLELQLTAPVQTAAAQQTLQIKLPVNSATRMVLTVPGNVEVKAGTAVVSREFDSAANRTRLELLPQRGEMSLALSLNNRLLQERRVLISRSVIVDEVTQGYERIHATVSYRVLHGAADKLRLSIPAGFDVTKVESVLLARWQVTPAADGRSTLEATLREPTSEQVVLHVTANRSPPPTADWLTQLSDWTFPRLEPLDTAGQVAVVGLVVEDRLQPQTITTAGLVPIDSAALAAAIPASILKSEPGAPVVRQVAAYYAPDGDYSLAAKLVRPPAELKVAGNSLLVIGDQGLTLQGGFALTPQAERLFSFAFSAPADWQVTQVTSPDGSSLPIERYVDDTGATRVMVRLVKGIEVTQTQTVNYQAVQTPAGWLTQWTTQTIEFPKIFVEGATNDRGGVAAQTVDDLVVRPETITGLTPLLDNEKAAFGLENIPTALAYRFDSRDFGLGLVVDRTAPSIAAQVYSFLSLQRDNLVAHYELDFDVREARTRQIAFSLPISTPTELAIRGLDSTVVKEFASTDDGQRRRWIVQLAERKTGRVRLAIDFTQHVAQQSQINFSLPLVQAEDVEFQSGLVAVEGDAELDIRLTAGANMRAVDVGELSGADYPLGRRVVGSYGYVGVPEQLQATITARDSYPLPLALIQRAELVTKVAAAGRSQSVARYDLLTKATLLEIRLPSESKLWSVYLDDQPTKPQRENESLLISLPAQERVALRKLQVVYESPSRPLRLSGNIDLPEPRLLIRAAGTDADREVPQADLNWQLILPNGYSVRRAGGTVDTDEIPPHELAGAKVARFLYELAGGIRPWYASSNRISAVSWEQATARTKSVEGHSASVTDLDRSGAMADGTLPFPTAPRGSADQPMAGLLPANPSEAKQLAQAQQQQQAAEALAQQRAAEIAADAGAMAKKGLWALDGVSSLRIDLEADSGPATTFRSLGERPVLSAVVIDERRIDAAAWGLALLVGLVGLGLTNQPARRKLIYVLVVLLASSVPLLLTTALDEVALAFDYVFFAGCVLAVYYVASAVVLAACRWLKPRLPREWRQSPATQATALILLAATVSLAGRTASAQQPTKDDDKTPVAVPADAIIIPYDPEKPHERAAAEKILVPYAKYVELWNRAHPDKRLNVTPPPVDFAIAATAYEATLDNGDQLSLVGRMEIEVFGDKPISVPLHLAGGVLERATVDSEPARLQFVEPAPTAAAVMAARPKTANPTGELPPRMLLLHLTGKGRKSVELHVRLGLTRQGGWRIVRGRIPVGPAAGLTLRTADAGTEIRQTSLPDRPTFETRAAGEKIETALGSDGLIELQWRPKVAEGMVDQALTARSIAAFDVREDSLRLTWQGALEFGRAFRDTFTLDAPADYLVEQVTGDSIRGWTVKTEGDRQRIDVTLLKPVQASQTLTVHLARRGRVGQGELAECDVPAVLVEGAALEQGEIVIRRSPRLELRTVSTAGLTRADSGQQTSEIEKLADGVDAAVLAVHPFQTFRFVRPPFRLTLTSRELPEQTSADLKAVVRVSERDTTLDAAISFQPQGKPVYRVRLYLPDGFTLERLGPADLEWSIVTENDRQLLTVHLLDGRTGPFTLTLLGKLAAPPVAGGLPAPTVEILDVNKQEGELAILPDPDTDVRLDNLRNCEAASLMRGLTWLKPEQQPMAKALLRYRTADYAATLTLTTRTPLISARSITNVKITPTSIEETVLLNFRVEQAGIRRVAFLVPEHLAKARLKAQLVKQKIVEPATAAGGQPIAGMVRFTLELQDYVRGEYAVLLEQDRLLTAGRQTVTLPAIETGRTDRRLVAVENAGRDEVVINPARDVAGLEPINRQEQAWRELAGVLGEHVTQAYAAVEGAAQPGLSFASLQREQAQRAGARIGLATTLLVVDRSGAYRALVQYRVSNTTEQFLELTLPSGARLWTAVVAGEPVKPAETVPPKASVVRIPLVKTAEGEGDYSVDLKYGGLMATSRGLNSVSFPLIRQTSINVEQSMVRLYLPQSQQWFGFQGTMRLVEDEGELVKGFQAYLGKRIQDATQALASGSDYTKVRAAVNLKQSRELLESNRAATTNNLRNLGLALGEYHESFAPNSAALEKAEQQLQEQLAQQRGEESDNRGRLNEFYSGQQVWRSKNVVSELGSNFDAPQVQAGKGTTAEAINPSFIEQNKLRTEGELATEREKGAASMPARPGEPAPPGQQAASRYLRGGSVTDAEARQLGRDQAGGAKAPEIAGKEQLGMLQKKLQDERQDDDVSRRAGGERAQQLQRYQQNLEMNEPQFGYGGRVVQGQPGMPGGIGGGGYAAPATGMAGAEGALAAPRPTTAGGEQLAQVAAGLASLDVQLPERGRVYRFTTPRGGIEIRARSVPVVALSRLSGVAAVLVAIAIFWLLGRESSRHIWRRLTSSFVIGLSLIIVGLASIFVGVLPLAGMLAIALGLMIAIGARRSLAAAAAR